MESTDTTTNKYSNIDLLIILGNTTLFDQETIDSANLEWNKRDLEDFETEALIKQIKDITEEGRTLVSRNKKNNIATFLKTKGINGKVAQAYAPEIKGSSIWAIVGSIFTFLIIIRFLFRMFG